METNFILATIISIASAYLVYFIWYSENRCDLNDPKNRNFETYYGLEKAYIPFGKWNAENNQKAPLFKQILPENLKAGSIIVIGEYGAGKTHFRNYRLKEYDDDKTEVIELISKNLDKYLEIYRNNGKAIENLNRNDIMNIIISEMIDKILKNNINQYKARLKTLDRDDRFKLASLVTFYSNSDRLNSLKSFLNEALHEDIKCFTCFFADINCKIDDQNSYIKIRNKLNDYYIYYDDQRDQIANLLFCIKKITGLSLKFLDEKSKMTQLKFLSDFLKTAFNKKIVLVVDSLDESDYLFNNTNPNLNYLQATVDSIMNLLTQALGNEDDVSFNILTFLPKIEGLKIIWQRKDKIPIIHINWNPKILHSFADFTLYNLKNEQVRNKCKPLPNFTGLLDNDDKVVKHVLESLRQPRDFFIFMTSLLKILNENALPQNPKPFLASKQNVEEALKLARNEMFKRN